MAHAPTQAHAPNPVATAHLALPTPVAAKDTQAVALVATSRAATGQSAVHALPSKAWRTTMMRNHPSILKTTSSPAPMRTWVRKAASTPLATNQAAAQAASPTPP